MNVTDSQRASSASTLVLGGLAANLGLTLLSFVVGKLVPGSSEGAWPMIEELLWLGAMVTAATGLFQLSALVEDGLALRTAAAALLVQAVFELAFTLAKDKIGGPIAYDVSMLISLATRGVLIFALVQATLKTHAWVLPVLGTVAALSLMRTGLSIAIQHQLIGYEVYRYPGVSIAMPLVSLFNAGGFVVAAFALKGAVSSSPNNTPALMAAAGLRPAEPEPVAPGADFLVGGILLAVGVGVTVISLTAASNGGRYVVATGAIGVGLGRIIRGFIRLAKSP